MLYVALGRCLQHAHAHVRKLCKLCKLLLEVLWQLAREVMHMSQMHMSHDMCCAATCPATT